MISTNETECMHNLMDVRVALYITYLMIWPGMQGHEDTCVICNRTGGDEHTIDGINEYIEDNIDRVQLREIVSQILGVLNENSQQITPEQVELHIREHMNTPKVTMHQTLRDLVTLSQLAKDACVCQCAESGKQLVDVKMIASYLKTVDRIVSVYKMDCMKA